MHAIPGTTYGPGLFQADKIPPAPKLEEFSRQGDALLDALQPLPAEQAATLHRALEEGSDVMNVRFVAGLIAERYPSTGLSERKGVEIDSNGIVYIANLANHDGVIVYSPVKTNVRDVIQRLVRRWRPYPFSTTGKNAVKRLSRSVSASIFRNLPDDLLDQLGRDEPRRWRFKAIWKKSPDGHKTICRFFDLPLSQAIRALRSLLVRVNEQAILTASRFSLPATPLEEIDEEIDSTYAYHLADVVDRAALSQRERELFELLLNNGMNHRQAAHDLSITWSTERGLFRRAKAKLRAA